MGVIINASLFQDSGVKSPELIWTNPSPSSSFTSQTINFQKEYKGYLIIFKVNASDSTPATPWMYVPLSSNAGYYGVSKYSSSSYNSIYVRTINSATSTSISIGGTNSASSVAVPIYIYGLTTDLPF